MSFDVRLWDQGAGAFDVILQPYGQPAQDWKTEEARWNSGAFGYAWPGGTVTAVAGGMRINWANSGFSEAPTSNPILGMNIRTRAGYRYTVTLVGDGTGTGADVRVDFPYVAVSSWLSPSSTTPHVVYFDETVDGSSYVGVAAQGPANGFSPGTNFTVASFTVVETLSPPAPAAVAAVAAVPAPTVTVPPSGDHITFIEGVETLWTSATTAYNVTAPATLTEGDFIWVQFVNADTVGSFTTVPSGWVEYVPPLHASGGNMITCYGHFVTSGEAASPPATWNFVWANSFTGNAELGVFRNVDQTSPLDVAYGSATTGTTTIVVASITTVNDKSFIIGGAQLQSATTQSINVTTGGWTEIGNSSTESAGRGAVLAYLGEITPAGAAGSVTFTKTSALQGYGYQAALRLTTGGTDATVTASVVAGTAAVPAPTPSAGTRPAPAAVAAVTTVPSPTPSAGARPTPAVVAAVAAVPAPTPSAGTRPAPAVVAAVATVPAPTASAGSRPTPATVAVVTAVPNPTESGGATAAPSIVVAVASVPAPTFVGNPNATVTAVLVAAVAAVPAPTPGAGQLVIAVRVISTAAVPSPTPSAGSRVTATVVAAPGAAVPSPTISYGAGPAPAVVAATTTVPVATPRVGSTIAAVTVAAVAAQPSPTEAAGSTIVQPATLAVAAVPAPTVNVGSTIAATTVVGTASVPPATAGAA